MPLFVGASCVGASAVGASLFVVGASLSLVVGASLLLVVGASRSLVVGASLCRGLSLLVNFSGPGRPRAFTLAALVDHAPSL